MKLIQKYFKTLLVTLAICLASANTFAETKTVTISQAFQSMLYLPLYIAIDQGFFREEGLEVIKETAGSPSAALSSVLSVVPNFQFMVPSGLQLQHQKGPMLV